MDNETTNQKGLEITSSEKTTRYFWKLDLNKFSRIWFTRIGEGEYRNWEQGGHNKKGKKEDDFKQIKVLFCILTNITPNNNSLGITIQDIADETGVSPDTVTRIMRKLRQNNFLQKRRNGLYFVNPYMLMQGPDDKKLQRLYGYYSDAKAEQARKDAERQQAQDDDPSAQPVPADSSSGKALPDEALPVAKKRRPPAEEYGKRSFWKFDLYTFSRIWYKPTSKKGQSTQSASKSNGFTQLKVLFYILQNIIPSNNVLQTTYQEIAANTGASTNTVIRIMRKLREADFLQKKRNGLYIINPYMLMQGRDGEKLSDLYQSYCSARRQNDKKQQRQVEKRTEVAITYDNPDADYMDLMQSEAAFISSAELDSMAAYSAQIHELEKDTIVEEMADREYESTED